MNLSLKIALRFLSSNIWQTILIVAGIAIGISVQVFIGSLLSGLQKDMIDTAIGTSSRITVIIIQVFVLIAVVLGIAGMLAISVVKKSRQLGILKAMGLKNFSSGMVFVFQGLLLGFCGGLLGIALGLGFALSFTVLAFGPAGAPVVNIHIDYVFLAFSWLAAIVSATLAALIPAIKSSRLDPMEVIRNG